MSHASKNPIISIPGASHQKRAAARKRAERARIKAAGLVAVTVHVAPEHRAAVRVVEGVLTAGDALTVRLLRMIAIIADKRPAEISRRRRLPKPAAADVSRIQNAVLIDFKTLHLLRPVKTKPKHERGGS